MIKTNNKTQKKTMKIDETIVAKRTYLSRYKNAIECIDRLKLKWEELDSRIDSLGGTKYDGMPHGSGGTFSSVDVVGEKVDIERRINNLEANANILKSDVIDVIDRVNNRIYVEVLESMYIDCLSMENTARALQYSLSRCKTIYYKALDEISLDWLK